MHLDHDHDETVHSHTHTHADGTTHTHTHAHAHDHENEHTHSHEDCAHTHCDACGGCEHSPKEELMALMKYMVGHNASPRQRACESRKAAAGDGRNGGLRPDHAGRERF